MPPPDARSRLASAQAALVHALVAGGEPPAGFTPERLRLAAQSLLNKRVREVAQAWPALLDALNDRFAPRFRDFARTTPPPAAGGPLADGRAFLNTLAAHEQTDAVLRARLWADLRLGAWMRLAWLPLTGRLLVGVRLPGGVLHMASLKLSLRRRTV